MSISLSDVSDGPYLAANDFTVGTIFPPMEICQVRLEDVPTPGKKETSRMIIVYFKGAKKGWCANKTERRKLGMIFNSTKDIDKTWLGAKVSLEIVGGVRRKDGTKGNAIRVHSATPPTGVDAGTVAASEETKEPTA